MLTIIRAFYGTEEKVESSLREESIEMGIGGDFSHGVCIIVNGLTQQDYYKRFRRARFGFTRVFLTMESALPDTIDLLITKQIDRQGPFVVFVEIAPDMEYLTPSFRSKLRMNYVSLDVHDDNFPNTLDVIFQGLSDAMMWWYQSTIPDLKKNI